MPIDDFTYLMKRGYTSQQLEKMVNDGVNIKALRIEESNKESKEKLGILTERKQVNKIRSKVRRLPCHKWGRMEIPVTTQKTVGLLD